METLNFEKIVNMHSFRPKEILFNSNSLCGECGEVANVVKKMQFVETNPNWVSEGLPTLDELKIKLNDELGDALFYIARVALDNGSNLSELMQIQANKLNEQSIKYNRTIIK